MKKYYIILINIILILAITSVSASAESKKRYVNINDELKSKTLSMKTVRISWKKHNADKYIIYNVTEDKKGNIIEKKIKNASGKSTSAVIKAGKNTFLHLHVKGINKKSKIIYQGDIYCWTGMATPQWDEYLYAEEYCSTSAISLLFNSDGGLRPTGYRIYRKEKGTSRFKKIKTLKTKKIYLNWKDKSVKGGKTYYYRVSAFRKKGKKTYLSKLNEKYLRSAVNFNGKYKLSTSTSDDQLTIKLTSDVDNGETIFNMIDLYKHTIQTDQEGIGYVAKAYSLDGLEWTELSSSSKKIRISPGSSFWIQTEKTTLSYYDEDAMINRLETSVSYRNVPCRLDVNIYSDSTSTYLDSESIH